MFRILDRYVIREVVPPFLLSLLAFTFILEIPPIMDVAERLIAKGVGSGDVVRIMVTLLPQALGVTIPMALLIGLLIGLGRLNADRELVVLQACGVSLYRLLRPVAVLGLLACAATAYVMIVALPDANQSFREITYRIVASRAEHEVRPRIFFEDFPNRVLYVREVPLEGGGWRDVFLADTSIGSSPDVYVARRGRILLDRERHKVEMTLEDGARHRLLSQAASQPEKYELLEFERMSFALDPDTVFPRTGPQRGAQELSIADLRAQIVELEARGDSAHPPIMVIHRKFSIPAACLVFALIGLALGISNRKDGKLASFVLGVAVIFAYYVIMYTAEALAKGQLVSPHLAMWIPNIVLGAFGVVLLRNRRRVSSSHGFAIPFHWLNWRTWRPRAAIAQPAAPVSAPSRNGIRLRVRIPRLWLPRFNILDGYVMRQYLRIFALTAVGLLGIFYIATFIDLSDKLFKGQTTGAMLARYFWYATPQYIYYVVPLATLISTLVAIGLLTKNSELVIMKACGISLYRIGAPLLLLAAIWSGLLFGLEESLLAHANRRAEETRHVIRGGSPQTFNVLNRKWIVSRGGDIYHYLFFDPAGAELNALSIYRIDQKAWRLASRSFATKAAYRTGWKASDGWIRSFSPDGESTYSAFRSGDLPLEPPEYFLTEQPDAERMTYPQLAQHIEELRASGFNVVPQLVALHRKLSFPFVTIIMTLLAVPFAVTTGSRGALYGVGAGLVLAIVYWILISVFAAIGSAGLIAPPLAAWTPNIMFLAGAGFLLLSART